MGSRADLLVWVDLEMTGLDPERCRILEIATLVTDGELRQVAEGPNLVVHATEEDLATLSDWSRDHFGRSGLLDRARESTVSREDAAARTLAFLREHCEPRTAPLCGNSVHMDRAFLRRWMPQLEAFLHYRNVDVSTLKELARRWYPKAFAPPPKAERHEARADILESVEELRYYRERFFVKSSPVP